MAIELRYGEAEPSSTPMSYASPPQPPPGSGTLVFIMLEHGEPGLETLTFNYPLNLVIPEPQVIDLPGASESSRKKREQERKQMPAPKKHPNRAPLIPPDPARKRESATIHTVFMLSYGGGIVASDHLSLKVSLCPLARLALLTQGSTRVFKSPDVHAPPSRSSVDVTVPAYGAIAYLPDPVQPFAKSSFEQHQVFRLESPESNVCVCDWVYQGRTDAGERWDVRRYVSRTEIFARGWLPSQLAPIPGKPKDRLLVRDVVELKHMDADGNVLSERVGGKGVIGTLIVIGPLFARLSKFFMAEFGKLPRIGVPDWDDNDDDNDEPDGADPTRSQTKKEKRAEWRKERIEFEKQSGIVWTAATVRGTVVVKFGGRDVETMRGWLERMLVHEGTVADQFGTRALYCLKQQ